MRLVVFADSTCNVYPGGNTLKQWMWDRNWTRYDQKGGAGYCLHNLTKELRDFISADNRHTKSMLMDETTCVVFIWNGNYFLGARYTDYVDDIQAPEAEQLRYLVSLSKLVPRFTLVSTTDNSAWGVGPLFAK